MCVRVSGTDESVEAACGESETQCAPSGPPLPSPSPLLPPSLAAAARCRRL
jgi:hypothetical protein